MANTTWRIDLDEMRLVGPEPDRRYSAREFNEQNWPPCPVCGTMIKVEGIPTKSMTELEPTYLPGSWRCPRGCELRP